MTALADRIRATIRANGPMPVALFSLMCLHDPDDGYYASRPGFCRDFVTAPEISQVFGELIGLWTAHEWRVIGEPSPVALVELGPGRGLMLADMLRAARAVPGFVEAARIACVEASPLLRAEQAARLQGFAPAFAADLGEVADGPMLLAANEFLDCLAVRQLVETPSGWRERAVGLDAEGRLAFGVGLPAEPPDLTAPAGGALEVAPAMETLTALLADRFSRHPGRALFIDYGPADASPGDTLRAFVNGRQVGPLDFPGEADLTSDVDFQRLKRLALRAGLAVHGPVTQRDFLLRLGARERAEALAAANPAHAAEIELALARLTEPEAMGERFKALCVSAPRLPPPAGFPLHGAPR